MKKLYQYIVEANEEPSNSVKTKGAAQRKAELEKLLKNKNYENYVDTLNQMLKDDKTKALLVDGFGGELGDMELDFAEKNISVNKFIPTQSEIDITNSINYAFVWPESNLANYFSSSPVEIKTPVITFDDHWIIDGHHRWSQIYCYNPKAIIKCYNYSSKQLSSTEMLKAVQGAIAAVKAENKKEGKLPKSVVNGMNIYDFKTNNAKDKKKLINYIKSVLAGKEVAVAGDDEHPAVYVKDNGEAFVNELSKYVKSVKEAEGLDGKIEAAAEYLYENLMSLVANHQPETGAPNRGEMPQTDQGAPDGNKKHAGPDDEGSALNKLADDKFVQGALK